MKYCVILLETSYICTLQAHWKIVEKKNLVTSSKIVWRHFNFSQKIWPNFFFSFLKRFKINFEPIKKKIHFFFYFPEKMGVLSHLHVTNQLFFSAIRRKIGKISVTDNFKPIAFSYGKLFKKMCGIGHFCPPAWIWIKKPTLSSQISVPSPSY